jgi:serine protease Do
MRRVHPRVALLGALLTVLGGGAGTEARAQYPRRTPIVEAVQKTRSSIVAIKAEKKGSRGSNEKIVGTGVIVDPRGYVITNCHVVAATVRVSVCLADGAEMATQVVSEDAASDLAVLRVQSNKSLDALPLGTSSDLMVGETVIAVGHPYGYTHTVSTGIVSAVGREITMPTGEVLSNLIQTNVGINPGNSGGPLLNINGELIGINVALREGAQGIAFAINADTVKQVLSQRLSALRVSGINHGLTCSESLADGPRHQRLVVQEVASKTPAADAGLRRGDEIIRVAEIAVTNRFDVERAFWSRKPGEQLAVTVIRAGKELHVNLKLPAQAPVASR